jgi:hypothetical protein
MATKRITEGLTKPKDGNWRNLTFPEGSRRKQSVRMPESLKQKLSVQAKTSRHPQTGKLFNSLNALAQHALSEFIKVRPYEHGLQFYKSRATVRHQDGEVQSTDWVQVHLMLDCQVLDAAEQACMVSNAPLYRGKPAIASYIFTALIWWAKYVKRVPATKSIGAVDKPAVPVSSAFRADEGPQDETTKSYAW